jgi:hypothetical protein
MRLRSLLLGLIGIAVACTPAPASTPAVWTIYVPASLRTWMAGLESCLPAGTVLALSGQSPRALHWGEPRKLKGVAFAIGEERPLVIAHPGNGVQLLGEAEVRQVFQGRVRSWKELGGADLPVEVWAYPEGEDGRRVLEEWLGAPITPNARLAMTPQEMLLRVQTTPGAIGWIGERWGSSGAIPLARLPAQPVLLVIPAPPGEAEARWIACLQAQTRAPSPPP